MGTAVSSGSRSASRHNFGFRGERDDEDNEELGAAVTPQTTSKRKNYDELDEDEDALVPVVISNYPIVASSFVAAGKTSGDHTTVSVFFSPPDGAEFQDATTISSMFDNVAVVRFRWPAGLVTVDQQLGLGSKESLSSDPKRIATVQEIDRLKTRNSEDVTIVRATGAKAPVDIFTTFRFTLPFKVDPEPVKIQYVNKANAPKIFEITYNKFIEFKATRITSLTATGSD